MESKTRNIGISNKELQLIFHLKANVWEILPESISSKSEDDQKLFFVRWLRAREHDLEKATEMLRNHLKWRLERNADEALKTLPHPFFMENYQVSFPAVDLKGQPVGCIALAEWDFRKVINIPERLSEFNNFIAFVFETCLSKLESAQNERTPNEPPVTQLTLIIDAKNYPYGQLMNLKAIKKILEVASLFEKNLPEILDNVFFINCPSYFGKFINLIKPVIAKKTMEKLTFYTNMNQWKAEINKFVDPATIPEKYGGLSKDVF